MDGPGHEVPSDNILGTAMAITLEKLRQLALTLPEVEEGTSYGTPAFRVKGKFFARLWEDGEVLVVKVGFDESEMLQNADPETFFLTDHYRGYPSVLVRLSSVGAERLRDVLEQGWRFNAPKRLLAAHDKEP
jgi:hypothetical protein